MEKLPFEIAQKLWIDYMVWHIFCKYAYPSLGVSIHPFSFEEWCKPAMYSIDGVRMVELPKIYEGKEYLSSQIQTFHQWMSMQ